MCDLEYPAAFEGFKCKKLVVRGPLLKDYFGDYFKV
jgi:hypothetical protein